MPTRDLVRRPQFDPIRVDGGLKISLFGLTIGRISLNLDITSLDQLTRAVMSRISVMSDEGESSLTTLSRATLYQMARDEQIGGRSAMSRAELIEALGRGAS